MMCSSNQPKHVSCCKAWQWNESRDLKLVPAGPTSHHWGAHMVARRAREQLTHEPATDQATSTCMTMHQLSNTPPRTKTMFWPLCRSICSRETPRHRGAGWPNFLWMQVVFWISCFTSSLLRTSVPWAPETCAWLHGIPRGPAPVPGVSEDALRWTTSQLVPRLEKRKSKDDFKYPSVWTKEDVKFHFDVFHEQNLHKKLFYNLVHILYLLNVAYHSFCSC